MISDQQFASLQDASSYLSSYCALSSARVSPVQSSPPYSFVYKLEETSGSSGRPESYLVRIALLENTKYLLAVIPNDSLSRPANTPSAAQTASSNLEDITAAANAAIAAAAAAAAAGSSANSTSPSSNNNNLSVGSGLENPAVSIAQQLPSADPNNNPNSISNAINSAAAGDIFNLIQSIAANAAANAGNMNSSEQLLLLMTPQQKAIYKLILELSASNNNINVPFIKQVLLHRYPQLANNISSSSSSSSVSNTANTDNSNPALDSDIDYCLKLISQVGSTPASLNKVSNSSNITSKIDHPGNNPAAASMVNPSNNIDPAIASNSTVANNGGHLKLDNSNADAVNLFNNANSLHNIAAAAAAQNAAAVRAAAAINAVSNNNNASNNVLGYSQMVNNDNTGSLATSTNNVEALNTNNASNANTYMIEPPKEQTFNSMEDAKEYLQNYMKITGVGLVIYKSGKNRGYALYRCERGGDPLENLTKRRSSVKELHANANLNSEGVLVDSISGKVIKKRNRKSRKMGCLFKVHIKLEKKASSQQNGDVKSENKDMKTNNGTPEGIYRLTVPCAVHNHPLVGDSIKDHPILRKRTSEHLNFLAMKYIEALYHAVRDPTGAVENQDHNPSGLAGVRPGTMKQLMKERFPDLSIIDKDIYNDLRKIKEQIKSGIYGQHAQENLKKVTLLLSASNHGNDNTNNHKMPGTNMSMQDETKSLMRDANSSNTNTNAGSTNIAVAAQQAAEVAAAEAAVAAVQQHQIQQAQKQQHHHQLQMQLQQQAQHEMLLHPLSSTSANAAGENSNSVNNGSNNPSENVGINNSSNDVQGALNEITDGNIDSAFLMENINNGDDNDNNNNNIKSGN